MTPEEKHLWYDFLKLLPVVVKRQKNICDYIVDFYIASAKLVIEVDGMQHDTYEHQIADAQRDATLSNLGLTVLRFSNRDVNQNFDAVAEDILNYLGLTAADLKYKNEP